MRRVVGVLAVALLAVVSAGAGVSESKAAEVWNPYVATPQAIGCGYCESCPGGGHEFIEDTDQGHPKSGINHVCFIIGCVEGGCNEHHDDAATIATAAAEDRQIAELLRQLNSGNVKAASRLLSAHANRVSLNRSRGAIQVVARCAAKSIIAHVPLTATQLRAASAH